MKILIFNFEIFLLSNTFALINAIRQHYFSSVGYNGEQIANEFQLISHFEPYTLLQHHQEEYDVTEFSSLQKSNIILSESRATGDQCIF